MAISTCRVGLGLIGSIPIRQAHLSMPDSSGLSFLDTIMFYGLVALLLWTPLAFGGVHPWAYTSMELHIFLLVIAWMVHIIGQRWLYERYGFPSRLVPVRLILPLLLFTAVIALQLTPLSPAVLHRLSPSTYELYSLFHPNWPKMRSTLSLHPYATYIELTKFLAYVGLFCFTVHMLRTPRRIRQVALAIVGGASLMALIGIVQQLTGTTSIYGFRDASYANFFGPFLNRNHFAAYQSMAVLLGLGVFLTPSRHGSDASPPRPSLRVWLSNPSTGQRLLLLFALSVMTGALVLSLSRGGVISFLGGLALLCFLLRQHQVVSRARLGLGLAALAAMSFWLSLTPWFERVFHPIHGASLIAWGDRWPVYKATWDMARDFPLLGIGLEAFPVLFARYQPADVTLRYWQAHNDVLQLLAETGWIGFLSLMGSLLGLLTAMVQRWRQGRHPLAQAIVPAGLAAFGAIFMQSFVDFSLRIPANALLLTVILALTLASASLPGHEETQHDAS